MAQDCGNSLATPLELPQWCIEASVCDIGACYNVTLLYRPCMMVTTPSLVFSYASLFEVSQPKHMYVYIWSSSSTTIFVHIHQKQYKMNVVISCIMMNCNKTLLHFRFWPTWIYNQVADFHLQRRITPSRSRLSFEALTAATSLWQAFNTSTDKKGCQHDGLSVTKIKSMV